MSQTPPLPASKWLAAEEAFRLICTGKANLNTLAQLVRGLFDLGLSGLVEPVLQAIDVPNPQWQAERASMLAQARTLPNQTISWAAREEIFNANLQSLS